MEERGHRYLLPHSFLGEVKLRLDQTHVGPCFHYLQVGQLILELQAAQKLRSEGNDLMKANKFADAVEKYTEALSGGYL